METLKNKINVEVFKSWLTEQKTIKDLFRWECSEEDAISLLCAAYQKEVEVRGMTCNLDQVYGYLEGIAKMMTGKSTKCGILLCGNCGNGKTTSMEAFISVSKFLRKLKGGCAQTGTNFLASTSARRLTQLAKDENAMSEAKRSIILCIDDIGLEPTEVLDYGNTINPVIEIIEQRYRQQLFTFITTNLTPKQIREKYGDRVADRFNETMKRIVYENPTFRR